MPASDELRDAPASLSLLLLGLDTLSSLRTGLAARAVVPASARGLKSLAASATERAILANDPG